MAMFAMPKMIDVRPPGTSLSIGAQSFLSDVATFKDKGSGHYAAPGGKGSGGAKK